MVVKMAVNKVAERGLPMDTEMVVELVTMLADKLDLKWVQKKVA